MKRSIIPALVAATLAAGCAQFSADGGMGEVADGVAREAGPDAGKSVVKSAQGAAPKPRAKKKRRK